MNIFTNFYLIFSFILHKIAYGVFDESNINYFFKYGSNGALATFQFFLTKSIYRKNNNNGMIN